MKIGLTGNVIIEIGAQEEIWLNVLSHIWDIYCEDLEDIYSERHK